MKFSIKDRKLIGKASSLSNQVCIKAGKYLLKHFHGKKNISYKGERANLVTDIDKGAERMIARDILSVFPDHDIVCEEGTERLTGSRYKWYVDPLDGTVNYVHGLPIFSATVALVIDDTIVCGAAYNPASDELYHAVLGKGSYRNGIRLHVSRTRSLSDGFLVTGFPYTRGLRTRNLKYFIKFVRRGIPVRRLGSASIDLCLVAAGIFDGFWELGLHSWDMAAGVLIAAEAGAKTSDLKGSKLDLEKGQILASNGLIHEQMLCVLNGNFNETI